MRRIGGPFGIIAIQLIAFDVIQLLHAALLQLFISGPQRSMVVCMKLRFGGA